MNAKRLWRLFASASHTHKTVFLLLLAAVCLAPWADALAGEKVKEMKWGVMSMTLMGGLALFLYGMEMMSNALGVVAGDRMKMILAKLTTNRFTGVATGAVVTAVIQSSSVTTVLVVGFITAGLMSFSQSLGVIFGANIGTTITAQIVAFKITEAAHLMIAGGFLMGLLSKKENVKQYGWMLMGLGMVFFGMQVMSDAMKPLRSYQPFLDLMIKMESPMVGILISMAFTGLIQSSSATTGIVIVMASQGFITLPAGIALAFGANIGTCVTALLASIGKPREAVRAALAHVMFNTLGVVVWYFFIDPLANFVTAISPTADHLTGMARLAEETPRQIANAHTIFNVANTILFIPFVNQFAAVINKILPSRAAPEAAEDVGTSITAFNLSEVLLATPSLALEAVRREIKGLGMRVNLMINDILPVVLHGDSKTLREIAKRDSEVDHLHRELVHYLGRISQTTLSEEQTKELLTLIHVVDSLENIGDVVETNLVTLGEQRIDEQVTVSAETETRIRAFHELVIKGLEVAVEAIVERDKRAVEQMEELRQQAERHATESSVYFLQRLTADAPSRMEAYTIEMDIMEKLRRVFGFASTIARQADNELKEYKKPLFEQAW